MSIHELVPCITKTDKKTFGVCLTSSRKKEYNEPISESTSLLERRILEPMIDFLKETGRAFEVLVDRIS